MTDQKALSELTDMLNRTQWERRWVEWDEADIKWVQDQTNWLQEQIALTIKRASTEALKDALRELNDHIDDGRAALDMLPDLIDEARRDTAEANSQFGVGA